MPIEQRYVQAVIRLIERGWCRHVSAKDAKGREVCETAPEATRFCLLGAMYRAQRDVDQARRRRDTRLVVERTRTRLHGLTGSRALSIWNDSQRSKRPVLRALKALLSETTR